MDQLKHIPKLNHSILPTPIHKLFNLSKKLNSNIFIKRDDLTGFGFGGSKTRKLDYIMADAMNKKADCLVTAGGNQSNFCRTLAAYAAYQNMECHMLYGEKIKQTGNQLLNQLFLGHSVHMSTSIPQYLKALIKTQRDPNIVSHGLNPYTNYLFMKNYIFGMCNKQAKKLILKGKKPYYVPLGGSTPLGMLGYVNSFAEINDQMKTNKLKFDKIFVTCGSCGTYAGMLVGAKVYNFKGKIIGICIGQRKKHVIQEIFQLSQSLKQFFPKIDVKKDDIFVDENYIGPGQSKKTNWGSDAIKLMASTEGIILDNVQTGKCFAGLLDYVKKGQIGKAENVLFNHTGGTPEIFAQL